MTKKIKTNKITPFNLFYIFVEALGNFPLKNKCSIYAVRNEYHIINTFLYLFPLLQCKLNKKRQNKRSNNKQYTYTISSTKNKNKKQFIFYFSCY